MVIEQKLVLLPLIKCFCLFKSVRILSNSTSNVIILKGSVSLKSFIQIKDWYWDANIKNMVFTDENGQKYKGSTHSVVIGKKYHVETDDTHSTNDYIRIIKWL